MLYYHRDTKRRYVSIFGELSFGRPYFYRKGQDGQTPLDGELSLGDDCYSDLVREVNDYLGVHGVYHKASDILELCLDGSSQRGRSKLIWWRTLPTCQPTMPKSLRRWQAAKRKFWSFKPMAKAFP